MEFTSIIELNTYLSDNLTKLDIKQYIKKYHDVLHQDIDVSFMDYFLYLCDHPNEMIIEHSKLKVYGVINTNDSSKFNRKLEDFIEGIDYKVLLPNVGGQTISS